MTSRKPNQITRRELAGPEDDIIDAEFVEIDPSFDQHPKAATASIREPRSSRWMTNGAIALVGIFVLLGAISLAGSNSSSGASPAETDSALADSSESSDQNPTLTFDANNGADAVPQVGLNQLVASNDLKACSYPDNADMIKRIIFPEVQSSPTPLLNLADYRVLVNAVHIELTNVTADGINRDTHEIRCTATLAYNDGESAAVSYRLRPSLQDDMDVIIMMQPPQGLSADILSATMMEIGKSAQAGERKTNRQSKGADDAPSRSSAPPPSDKDLYEPH